MTEELPLARLNDDGMTIFERFIVSHERPEGPERFPAELLEGRAYSTSTTPSVNIACRRFTSRFALAAYLSQRFDQAGLRAARNDAGLWTWLACAYFQLLLADTKDRDPGKVPRWIFKNTDYRRYYRHLIAGPFFTYQAYKATPEVALALLCQPPGRPGDVVEQLASRQEFITNGAVMEIATRAFVDMGPPVKQRRGAGGKGPGSARRFVSVIDQFRETWDISTLSADELAALLPGEFKVSVAKR